MAHADTAHNVREVGILLVRSLLSRDVSSDDEEEDGLVDATMTMMSYFDATSDGK